MRTKKKSKYETGSIRAMTKKFLFIFPLFVLILIYIIILTSKNKTNNQIPLDDLTESWFSQKKPAADITFELLEKKYANYTHTFLLTINNQSDNLITYGDFYVLEVFLEGKWYEVCNPGAWYDISYELNANCSSEVTITIENCPALHQGTYRILKDVTLITENSINMNNYYIAANFSVK